MGASILKRLSPIYFFAFFVKFWILKKSIRIFQITESNYHQTTLVPMSKKLIGLMVNWTDSVLLMQLITNMNELFITQITLPFYIYKMHNKLINDYYYDVKLTDILHLFTGHRGFSIIY